MWSVLVLLLAFCTLVDCSGRFSLRFVRFVNPGSRKSNGEYCDDSSLFGRTSACDHKFNICVNKQPRGRERLCSMGTRQTTVISDQDTNVFGRTVGGVSNPMTFRFSIWPGAVNVVVRVIDDDYLGEDDHVDTLSCDITVASPSGTETTMVCRGRTMLTIRYAVICDHNYYGPNCAVYCTPQNSDRTGHYRCNERTGAKECHSGWEGPNCRSNVNDCRRGRSCFNGGTCVDRHLGYICQCRPGFKGQHCEVNTDECASSPCQNGGRCIDQVNQYECLCLSGWTGVNCEVNVNECASNPCQNQGQCIDKTSGYECQCAEGYTGSNCRTEIESFYTLRLRGNVSLTKEVEQTLTRATVILLRDLEPEGVTKDRIQIEITKTRGLGPFMYTEVVFVVSGDEHTSISNTTLKNAFEGAEDKLIKLLYPLEVYGEEHKNDTMTTMKRKDSEKNWLDENWYVPVCGVFLLIFIVCLTVGVVRKRNRRLTMEGCSPASKRLTIGGSSQACQNTKDAKYTGPDFTENIYTEPRGSRDSTQVNSGEYMDMNGGQISENKYADAPRLATSSEDGRSEHIYFDPDVDSVMFSRIQ